VAAWTEILEGVQVALSGEAEQGRRALLDCWSRTDPSDAAQRCVLAHYLADLEADAEQEAAWDERALEAFGRVADEDLMPVGIASAAAMAPSLHLNLGEVYRRLGRVDEAQEQAAAGLASVWLLADDGYGHLIREGLARLAERLGEPPATGGTG